MEKIDYVVKRDEIFTGLLMKETSKKDEGEVLRRIHFIVDENFCANDLLYNAPHYPISLLNENELLLIKKYYYMGELLKKYGFPQDMTYDDVLKIEVFFKYGWKFDNAHLFGYFKPLQGENSLFREIDHRFDVFKSYKLAGEGSPLPNKDFYYLWNLSNPWNINTNREMDISLPNIKEENVKKLTR